MCSVWDGLGLAFVSQQRHSNFNEIQDLEECHPLASPPRNPDFWCPQSMKKAGPHMAVLMLVATPLRSTSLSS